MAKKKILNPKIVMLKIAEVDLLAFDEVVERLGWTRTGAIRRLMDMHVAQYRKKGIVVV